jgi:hypothetical protein
MKKIFGLALFVLPLAMTSVRAEGWPLNIQASGSFSFKSTHGPMMPQAGPWYLYWPMEAHFVAPAPTGYPYWPPPQGLPNISIGGPACPPPAAYAPPPVVAAPPAAIAPAPATQPAPQAAPTSPQTTTPAGPKLQFPPYLQPTSYSPIIYTGQAPSYWYDR